jgi:hypothetical protein
MNVTARIMIVALLVSALDHLQAQSAVEVSRPALSLKNNKVQIEYDLLNTARSEKFSIRIEVTGENGKSIPAETLSGDVGKGVSGGPDKKILWDIEADSVFLNEEISVQVYALPEAPPVAETPPVEVVAEEGSAGDALADNRTTEPGRSAALSGESSLKEFNRAALIIQSVALPGLGLSRATGKPHWIRGAAGYGCIAASVCLNRTAYSTYQSYLDPESIREADDLYSRAQSQKTTSQVLAYAAIGIWVADLVWTIVGTSDLPARHASLPEGFSIGTTLEPHSSVPLLALRYRF